MLLISTIIKDGITTTTTIAKAIIKMEILQVTITFRNMLSKFQAIDMETSIMTMLEILMLYANFMEKGGILHNNVIMLRRFC